MTTPRADVAKLLDQLGLAIGAHQVEIVDFNQAEKCHVHHTQAPVALAGYALVSTAFATGRFPKFLFLDMVAKRSAMDEREACALAAVCGTEAEPPFWGNPAPFGKQVWAMVERYDLGEFFERLDPKRAYGRGGDHYLLRPRGHDSDPDSETIKAWRRAYKQLPPVRQLMVATIVRLYNSNETHWLVRVPKTWHAAEGVAILREHSALADWGRLVALYPGW